MWAGMSSGNARNPPIDAISTSVAASRSTLRIVSVTAISTAARQAVFRGRSAHAPEVRGTRVSLVKDPSLLGALQRPQADLGDDAFVCRQLIVPTSSLEDIPPGI